MDESMSVKKFIISFMGLIVILIGWGVSVQVRLATHEEKMNYYEKEAIKRDNLIEELNVTQEKLNVTISNLNTYLEAKGV